mmetsp:Transcript_18847/g.52591  ORF Transcript_18847/g.52591 Transcript_18847/m.52591 type:complete len:216 (-) Transcript_18847:1114-1761(-)
MLRIVNRGAAKKKLAQRECQIFKSTLAHFVGTGARQQPGSCHGLCPGESYLEAGLSQMGIALQFCTLSFMRSIAFRIGAEVMSTPGSSDRSPYRKPSSFRTSCSMSFMLFLFLRGVGEGAGESSSDSLFPQEATKEPMDAWKVFLMRLILAAQACERLCWVRLPPSLSLLSEPPSDWRLLPVNLRRRAVMRAPMRVRSLWTRLDAVSSSSSLLLE